MKSITINGRQIQVADNATPEQIAQQAGLSAGRRIIKRDRRGNYPQTPGEPVQFGGDNTFVDAPKRVKGASTELDASGATGFVLVMLGGAALAGFIHGPAPFLVVLVGLFAAFLFVGKFMEMVA